MTMFKEWMAHYEKSYSTEEEQKLRFYTFVDNINRAKELNEKLKMPQLYGITKFSDLSKAEFKAKYLLKNYQPTVSNNTLPAEAAAKITNPLKIKIAASGGKVSFKPAGGYNPNTLYDWGADGYTTAIKNQGQCGSCWAFSATEQTESNYAMKHSLPQPLSVQQIVDCDTKDGGCNGGTTQGAYTYIMSAGGLEYDSVYPYTGVQGKCQFDRQPVIDITGYQSVSQYNEAGMFNFLSTGGPLSICLNANNLETYNGGNQILPGSTCDPNDVDHCVQLTGFLTDANGNIAAWNVRNSWGTDWGNAGYAFLQYGVNACGLDSDPTIVTVN
jgi:C1A family cysteine protease